MSTGFASSSPAPVKFDSWCPLTKRRRLFRGLPLIRLNLTIEEDRLRNFLSAAGTLAVLFAGPLELIAQTPPAPVKPETAKPAAGGRSELIPLRLLVTVSRYQGEKKIS